MARIAIYDSGVGGLSIVQQITAMIKSSSRQDDQVLFVSDNAAYPYGVKNDKELLHRVAQVSTAIFDQIAPQVLVVACNTASTVALPWLREMIATKHIACDVVGVVPAIKPAAQMSRSKVIGLLATPATIERDYTRQLVQDFASDCQVVSVGSSELVDMAEAKLAGQKVDLASIRAVLAPFERQAELDTLVLACTHFPLLNKEISEVIRTYSRDVRLIDSGVAVARRTANLLEKLPNAVPSECESETYQAYFTKPIDDQSQLKYFLRSIGFEQFNNLEVSIHSS